MSSILIVVAIGGVVFLLMRRGTRAPAPAACACRSPRGPMKRWIARVVAASLGFTAMAGLAAELGWKKSTRHAVMVTVIPRSIEPGADAWEFLVAFESHLRSHLEKLPDRAVLVGPHGGQEAAIEWEQLPPAPFLRQGAVRFKPIAPWPKTIELRVKLVGEPEPRAFRWNLQQRDARGQAPQPVLELTQIKTSGPPAR